MTKPIIAVDMDDVLVDSTSYWHEEVNKRTGANIPRDEYRLPGEYSTYYKDIWHRYGVGHLISVHDIDSKQVIDQSDMPPYRNAFNVLKSLSKKYLLYVVTARSEDQYVESLKWIENHYPGVFEEVICMGGRAIKADECMRIGALWLIDDSIEHCKKASDKGIHPILFGDYGWQQNVPNDMIRCKDWQAVQEYFDGQY